MRNDRLSRIYGGTTGRIYYVEIYLLVSWDYTGRPDTLLYIKSQLSIRNFGVEGAECSLTDILFQIECHLERNTGEKLVLDLYGTKTLLRRSKSLTCRLTKLFSSWSAVLGHSWATQWSAIERCPSKYYPPLVRSHSTTFCSNICIVLGIAWACQSSVTIR